MRIVFVLVALVSVAASAQVSVEEAQQKLQEKQEARQKAILEERAQLVTIAKGELADLKAELAALRKEVATLRAAQAPPDTADDSVVFQKAPAKSVETTAGLKYVLEVKVGVTRQQLFTYVSQHKDSYRILKDLRKAGDKQELITLEKFRIKQEFAGTSSNGVNTTKEYRDVKVPLDTWELVLINDVITDMSLTDNRPVTSRSR